MSNSAKVKTNALKILSEKLYTKADVRKDYQPIGTMAERRLYAGRD